MSTEAKVEQWMRDAAVEIFDSYVDWGSESRIDFIAEIIASYAPKDSPACTVEVDQWGTTCAYPNDGPRCSKHKAGVAPEREGTGAPASVSSDESATVISSACAGDSPKGQGQDKFSDEVARQEWQDKVFDFLKILISGGANDVYIKRVARELACKEGQK